ncbi:MAG TPA: two-component regulator propeller domain-containing protein, partial [Chitinophagaceae bacterium]|nr:two-component regulator propeller domain-containing protein [Chitinophagaceae bacterium]
MLVIVLLICLCAAGQSSNFLFRNFNSKNGLSYNLVYCLLQDREGYTWVGTFNGLNRFDGSRFISFKSDPDDQHTLSNNIIHKMCEDTAGNIWIATGSGICRYNKQQNSFTRFFAEQGSKDFSRRNIFINILADSSGNIWCTSAQNLYKLDAATGSFTAFSFADQHQGSTIFRHTLHRDPHRNWLWIGTDKGIQVFDIDKKLFYNHRNNPFNIAVLNDHSIFPMIFDRKKQLVFADNTARELVVYHPAAGIKQVHRQVMQNRSSRADVTLTCIAADRTNNYWISHQANELHYYNEATKKWSGFGHDKTDPASINSDYFNDVLEDKEGRLYFGCLNGLAVMDPVNKPLQVLHPLRSLSGNKRQDYEITCLLNGSRGQVYVGTNGGGLVQADVAHERYRSIRMPGTGESVNNIMSLAQRGRQLWVGTGEGLYVMDTATGVIARPALPSFLQNAFIRFVHHDKSDQTWISINRKGILQYDHSRQSYTLHNPDSIFIGPGYYTTGRACIEDADGNIWVGSYSGKLYKYERASGRWHNIVADTTQHKRIFQRTITAMHSDGKGRIWMSTDGGGVIVYDPSDKSFRSWMEKDGLLMNVCIDIFGDARGNIWVNSYEGVNILDPVSGNINHPDLDYGFQENNFFSRGHCILPDGDILLANMGNLVRVDPAAIVTPVAKADIKITGITIAGNYHPVYKGNIPVELSYRDNIFSIDYSSMQAAFHRNVEYSYRLRGFSDEWMNAGFNNTASFTGLQGGDYSFEVRARLPSGEWSAAAVLPVYIRPPFWQTWWFRLLMVVVAAGAIAAVIKLRERRIIREQRMQSEFREHTMALEMKVLRSQMNPHFIFNSLNSIRLFVLQNKNEDAEKYLVQFSRLMRLILDNSRHEWVSLQSELQLLRLYLELEQLRFDHKFDFHLDIDEELDAEQVFIPPMTLQPYVENAILHGLRHKHGRGNIWIRAYRQQQSLQCVVEDDGVGRARSQQLKQPGATHKSMGTRVTEERLQLL